MDYTIVYGNLWECVVLHYLVYFNYLYGWICFTLYHLFRILYRSRHSDRRLGNRCAEHDIYLVHKIQRSVQKSTSDTADNPGYLFVKEEKCWLLLLCLASLKHYFSSSCKEPVTLASVITVALVLLNGVERWIFLACVALNGMVFNLVVKWQKPLVILNMIPKKLLTKTTVRYANYNPKYWTCWMAEIVLSWEVQVDILRGSN